jgi:hypothetical protein
MFLLLIISAIFVGLISVMQALAVYEQTQVDAARDSIRGTELANS